MSYQRQLKIATEAALEAGDLLRAEFHRPGGPRGSGAHAEADEEAEQLIRKRIREAFPAYGYRGEETGSAGGTDGRHIWLVDPNDGTSAYLRGARGSSVSIGLLRDGVPILGVVYAFMAPDDHGDMICWAEGGELTRNGAPVQPKWNTSEPRHVIVLVSPHRESMAEQVAKCVHPYRYIQVPSIAYRLALVAAGDGEAAVSWHRPGDWDYAAGHALLLAAGGLFINEAGVPVAYSASGESKTKRCFGGDPVAAQRLLKRDWASVQQAWESRKPAPPSYFHLARPQTGKSVSSPALLSRAQGCLLGQCAGDALGQQVEFSKPEIIRRLYPRGVRLMEDGGSWHNIAGQITDDSEMALMLARSILHAGKYDREAAAHAYYHWYNETEPFDSGMTIRQAVNSVSSSDVKSGLVSEAMSRSASRSSQANGSLMRISPLAIYGYRMSRDQLWDLAARESALTHPHPVCAQACGLYVNAIAEAVRESRQPRQLFESMLQLANDKQVDEELLGALEAAQSRPPDCTDHAGWVLVAFQNAIHELLHAGSFEEGVIRTVERGGDTDTNAAIAGALLGALYGRGAVPRQWEEMVLSCRPMAEAGADHPRPLYLWPVDIFLLAEHLLCVTA